MPLTSSYRQLFRDAFIGKPGASLTVNSWWLGLYSYDGPLTAFGDGTPASGELPVGSYGYSRIPMTPDFFDQSQSSMGMYVNTTVAFGAITAPSTWALRGFSIWDAGSGGNPVFYSNISSGPTFYGFDPQLFVHGPRTPNDQKVIFPVGSLRFDFASDESSIGAFYKWGFKTKISSNVANRMMQALFLGESFWVSSVYIGLSAVNSSTLVSSEADFTGYSRIFWPSHRWEPQCVTSLGLYDPTITDTPGLTIGVINRLPAQWRCYSLGTFRKIYGVMIYGFINGQSPALELLQSNAGAEITMTGPPGIRFRDENGDVSETKFPVVSLAVNSATGGMSYSTITVNVGSLFLAF